MLDQLIKLVERNAGDAIVKNQAIPNQFNTAAIEDVAQQIFGGLQGRVSQGNMQEIASLFQGDKSSLMSSPMVSQIVANIAGNLAGKFGVSPQVAQGIAAGLIPQVMSQFVTKTNDPSDGDFDLQDMLKGLGGGSNLDIGSIVKQVSGGGSAAPADLRDVGNMLGKIFGEK